MLTFNSLTPDDLAQLNTAFDRAGLAGLLPRLEVAHDRQGRFSVCCLKIDIPGDTIFLWGAARQDSHDQDDPAVGRRLALHKAGKSLIGWIKGGQMSVGDIQHLPTPQAQEDAEMLKRGICGARALYPPLPINYLDIKTAYGRSPSSPDPAIKTEAGGGWRNASAEKPEAYEKVLGYQDCGANVVYWGGLNWWEWSGKTWATVQFPVTHWRPLPVPPGVRRDRCEKIKAL